MTRHLFAFLIIVLLLCPLAFGVSTSDKAKATEEILTQQDHLNGYTSEWNYTVDASLASDEANSVAVDRQRNIIVVGVNRSISPDTSWLIMKLTSDGALLWARNYNFSSGDDSATGVAVDSDNNITIVGYDRVTTSPTDVEWRILKLAPDGALLWTNSFNFSSGDERPWDVAIDSQNNTVAVGYDKNTGSSSDFEWRVVKLARDGTLLWTDSYNFSSGVDMATAVAIDHDDNITVVGYDGNISSTDREWRIIKITPEGSNLFQNYPFDISPDPDEPTGVAIDSQNNTIVVGFDRARGDYTSQWVITKFNPAGNQVWNHTVKNDVGIGTSSFPLHDVAKAVAIDSSNNITVVGYFRINDTAPLEANNQWAIMKFGYDGSSLWNYTGNFSPFNDEAKAIAFDSYDDMVVVGFDSASGYLDYQWRIMKFKSLSSNVHNIDTGLNYATIQEAIDANETLDGHTILVDSGTYFENVVVNKSVSIIGENRDTTIIDGQNVGNTICIASNRVLLNNLTITDCGPPTFEALPAGIYLNRTENSVITNNNVSGNNCMGIIIWGGQNNSISSNLITHNREYGMLAEPHDPLAMSYSSNIVGNSIASNFMGLVLDNGNNTIVGNTFTNDGLVYLEPSWGLGNIVSGNTVNGKPLVYLENSSHSTVPDAGQVVLVHCDDMRVENLDLSHTVNGLQLRYTDNCQIVNNTITTNNYDGIKMDYSSNNTIKGNTIILNRLGIELATGTSTANTISQNNISANEVGLWINGLNNSIYHNDFTANTYRNANIDANLRANTWDDGYPSGGNYWSDYVGADLNGDGIGDSPYTIGANNTDRYPLMGHFSSSSATSEFDVSTISNSTVSPVVFDYLKSTLSLNVTGSTGTKGFCRLEIPRILMQGPYVVMLDGTLIDSTELSASNSTHAFLYFTYTHSTHQAMIEPEVLYQIQDLLGKYDQLLVDYSNLNSSYYELLNNDTVLASNFAQLNQSYNQLNATYQQHLQDYAELKANYTLHFGDYSSLRNDYSALNQSYSTLQANHTALSSSYDSLNSTLTDYKQSMQNELSFTRNLVYVFIGITIILLATTVYLVARKPKTKPET